MRVRSGRRAGHVCGSRMWGALGERRAIRVLTDWRVRFDTRIGIRAPCRVSSRFSEG